MNESDGGESGHFTPANSRVGTGKRRAIWSTLAVWLILAGGLVIVTIWQLRLQQQLVANAQSRADGIQAAEAAQLHVRELTHQLELERQARETVDAAALKTRKKYYNLLIKLAGTAVNEERLAEALEHLEHCRPGPGETDLRRFEWYHLDRRCHPELLTIDTPAEKSSGVIFSPDGTEIASVEGRLIVFRDAATGKTIRTLQEASGELRSIAYSPDGQRVGVGVHASPPMLAVWDVAKSERVCECRGHTDVILKVAFRPDGKQIASASADETIRLWQAETGQLLHTLEGHAGAILDVAYSPDGTQLASAGVDWTVVVWDANTGQELVTHYGHEGAVMSVAFRPDGKELASAGVDAAIRFWPVGEEAQRPTDDENLVGFLTTHRGVIRGLAFSHDGQQLVSASEDRTIKLWNAETREEIHTFLGHLQPLLGVALARDGMKLVSYGADRTIKIWDLVASAEPRRFAGNTYLYCVAFSRDGSQIATGDLDHTITLWDAVTGQELQKLKGHQSSVVTLS
ncbi:MAG: WD40 repeat domain-containing protein, partial [Planctomycetes bacterium]|nr:WD40 repeat domain-containing protein [Planctomycetota bacterium]